MKKKLRPISRKSPKKQIKKVSRPLKQLKRKLKSKPKNKGNGKKLKLKLKPFER